MRLAIVLLSLEAVATVSLHANMAAPFVEGTLSASPFVSQFVDITQENIHIEIGKDFKQATYSIKYHINANRSGTQIPLLFFASDYQKDFEVFIDEEAIDLLDVPDNFNRLEGRPISDFEYLFETDYKGSTTDRISLMTSATSGYSLALTDLKYFEVDLPEGNHAISVRYIASAWTDLSGYINTYSFRYVLSPAAYWKSFGILNITIDASSFDGELTTNIGNSSHGGLSEAESWRFDSIPVESLMITYVPQISTLARTLIWLSPAGIVLIILLFIGLINASFIIAHRKKNPDEKSNELVTFSSLLSPFIILFLIASANDWIWKAIGEHASYYGGYGTLFGVVIFVPTLSIIYIGTIRAIDKYYKNKFML